MKEITAFKCDHCNKIYESPVTCKNHQRRCYYNPKTNSCITCAFFIDDDLYYDKNRCPLSFSSCLLNNNIINEGLRTKCPNYQIFEYRKNREAMHSLVEKYDHDTFINRLLSKPSIADAINELKSIPFAPEE